MNNIRICNEQILAQKLDSADKCYFEKEFQKAYSLFHECIGNKLRLTDIQYYRYLMTVAKIKNLEISEENPIYKRLYFLKESYERKYEEDEIPSVEECNVNNLWKKYKMQDVLSFGKYSGDKLIIILMNDPHYLLWCIVNLDYFYVENSVLCTLSLQAQSNFYISIEQNLLKDLFLDKWYANQNAEYGYPFYTFDADEHSTNEDAFKTDWDDLGFSDPSEYPGSDFC